MNQYIEPVKSAVLLFPLVALAFTLPYMLVQYRRYGAILLLRTAIIYSFILYLMCAYFLTILPLPRQETVARLTSPTIQLIPFRELVDLFMKAPVDWSNPATYYKIFVGHDFFQVVANIAMTVPFGIYLRYYFQCSFKKTLLLSLGLSLIFELTQLSGLFGIYPRPYRLADVDDLMTNTFGGLIGYWIAPWFMKVLPSKERMDEVAYRRGTQVSVTRRAFGAMIDDCILGVICMVAVWLIVRKTSLPINADNFVPLCFGCYALGIVLYFMVGEWLFQGKTIGKKLTHLRLTDSRDGSPPKLWQCVVRNTVLYLLVLPAPMVILSILLMAGDGEYVTLWMIIVCMLLLLVYITFWLVLAVHVLTHSIHLLHEKLSMTLNVSTLRVRRGRRSKAQEAAELAEEK